MPRRENRQELAVFQLTVVKGASAGAIARGYVPQRGDAPLTL
jgi:hypothetical protein